jgi:hypothetical protein
MFRANVVDKTKTHVLSSAIFPENLPFNEIMWKNMVEPYRTQQYIYIYIYVACALHTG